MMEGCYEESTPFKVRNLEMLLDMRRVASFKNAKVVGNNTNIFELE